MLLPDRQTRLALGPYLPNLVGYWSSRRGPVATGGAWQNLEREVYHGTVQPGSIVAPGSGLICGGGSVHPYAPVVMSFGINDFTFSCWVKTSVLATQNLMAKNAGLTWAGVLFLRTTNPFVRFRTGSVWNNSFPMRVDDNVWHLITASRINSVLYIFLDGELIDSQSGAPQNITNSDDFLIGRGIAPVSLASLSGNIDEGMVFNGAGIPLETHRALYETQRYLFGV